MVQPLPLYANPPAVNHFEFRKTTMQILLVILLISILLAGGFLIIGRKNTPASPAQIAGSTNSGVATYSPAGSDREIYNPFIGFVGVAENTEPLVPIKLAFANISWAELEPVKGVYDFETFEKRCNFDYWRKNGVTLVFRFYMDYPSDEGAADIPYWLYSEINKDGNWYFGDARHQGFSPNYANPLIKEYHTRLIKALAERYNNDDFISYVEIGSVGHWGEWHTTYVDHEKSPFPKASITDAYVMDYVNSFTNKKLLIRRPFDIAKKYNFGLFNDSFGDIEETEDCFINWFNNGYISNNNKEPHPAMPDFWKTAPSGGEMANKPSFQYIEDETIDRTIQQLKNSHTSWLGPSGPFYEEMTETQKNNLARLQMLMGYRFSVKRSEYATGFPSGCRFTGTLNILNSGVAPFYFDWTLQMTVTDAAGTEQFTQPLSNDIKNILPGENKLPYTLSTGKLSYAGLYRLNLRMINPKHPEEELELANEEFTFGKGVPCGEFEMAPSGGFACDTLRYSGFYNYISYWNSNLTFKVIRDTAAAGAVDTVKLTQTKNASQNWMLSLSAGSLDSSVSSVRLTLDDTVLLTVSNTADALQIIGDQLDTTIQKEADKAIRLEVRKSGKSVKFYLSVGTQKEVLLGQCQKSVQNKTNKLSIEYSLQPSEDISKIPAGTLAISNVK